MKPFILVLAVVCLGLTAALVIIRQKAETQLQTARAQSARAITDFEEIKAKHADLEKLYAVQQGTLNMRSEELAVASNRLAVANTEVSRLTADLKTLQAEMLQRQERIAALESQRDDLSKKMEDLTANIDSLEKQISQTKQKLATAEGDKSFLLAELKRLQTDKDLLTRQFNDLASLRGQVAKLKEEAAIKQRLEWKRIGLYAMQEKKGAERLFTKTFVPSAPQSRLDAELHQGGRIVPTSTNSVTGAASSADPAVTAP